MGNESVCSFCTETDKCEEKIDKNIIIRHKTSPISLKKTDIRDSNLSHPRFNFSKDEKYSSYIIGNFGIIKCNQRQYVSSLLKLAKVYLDIMVF